MIGASIFAIGAGTTMALAAVAKPNINATLEHITLVRMLIFS
jgi:hypothetical protein